MSEDLRRNCAPEAAAGRPNGQTENDRRRTDDVLLMLQASRALTFVLRQALRPVRLRVELWMLLELLADEPKRITELATEVAGLKGSVSRWVGELHTLGLVGYRFSVKDQREKPVSITASGSRQLALARDRIAHALLALDLPAGERERARVIDLCRRLQISAPERVDGRRR